MFTEVLIMEISFLLALFIFFVLLFTTMIVTFLLRSADAYQAGFFGYELPDHLLGFETYYQRGQGKKIRSQDACIDNLVESFRVYADKNGIKDYAGVLI